MAAHPTRHVPLVTHPAHNGTCACPLPASPPLAGPLPSQHTSANVSDGTDTAGKISVPGLPGLPGVPGILGSWVAPFRGPRPAAAPGPPLGSGSPAAPSDTHGAAGHSAGAAPALPGAGTHMHMHGGAAAADSPAIDTDAGGDASPSASLAAPGDSGAQQGSPGGGHAGSNAANTSTLSTAFGTAAQGQARHAHIPSDDLSGALLARKSVSRSCWRTLVAGAARGAACLPLPFLPPGLAGKLCW